MVFVFGVLFGDGVFEMCAAAAGGEFGLGLGCKLTLADAILDHGAEGIGDKLVHADFELAADVVKLGEFIDGEFDGEGAIHFFSDPIGDGSCASFPLNDGRCGTANVFGEFFTGEHALFAQVEEDFRGHHLAVLCCRGVDV